MNRTHARLPRTTLLLVFLLIPPAASLASDPWQGPYEEGKALWHFDSAADGNSPSGLAGGRPAHLQGKASIDAREKVYGGGSLRLAGGSATVDAVDWRGGDRSFELFMKVRAYPPVGREADLVCLVDAKGNVVHRLSLTHDGGLKLTYRYRDYLQERYDEQTTFAVPAGTVPPGRWTHVAFGCLGYYNMVRLSVDGRIVGEEHGLMHDGPLRLVLGNSPAGDRPFDGWVDEAREASERAFATRLAPQDWVRPASPAAKMTDAKFFPNADSLLFYANFDANVAPVLTAGERSVRVLAKDAQPRFAAGIHGQALSLGCPLEYGGQGNIRPGAGTVSMWIKFDRKPDDLGRFFMLNSGWSFMLSGGHWFYAASVTGRGVLAGQYWGGIRGLRSGRWHHVALSWIGEWCRLFLDGEPDGWYLVPDGLKPFFGQHVKICITDGWAKYGPTDNAFVDEYRIFGRALSDEEIANLYRVEAGQPLLPVTAKATVFQFYPGSRRIVALVSQDADGIEPGKGLRMTMVAPDGRVVAGTTDANLVLGTAEMVLDFPPVPAGKYTIRVTQTAAAPAPPRLPITDSCTYEHQDYAWAGTDVGDADKVLDPWTPLKADAKGSVEVWNRRIELDGLALPRQITVDGEAILADGMHFELQDSVGNVSRLVADARPAKIQSSDTHAEFLGRAEGAPLSVQVRNRTEYDGCGRLTVTLGPPAGGQAVTVQRLTLVIPLKRSVAGFLNAKSSGIRSDYLIGAVPAEGDDSGLVFGSHILKNCGVKSDPVKLLAEYRQWQRLRDEGKAIPKSMERFASHAVETSAGSFIPYLWVGNPDAGLCWFADSDEGWARGDMNTPAIEIRQVGSDRTEVRLNILAATTKLNVPRQIVFGLMPTPVRPLKPGWRGEYWYRPYSILGFGYEFQSGRYYLGQGCPGAYGGEPYPWDPNRAKWLSAIFRKRGILQVPYFEFTNTYDPITAPMALQWRDQPQAWQVQGGLLPVQSYADWFCYWFDRYVRDVGIDGLYLDNVCPLASLNTAGTDAWRSADGRLEGGWNLWGMRSMFRRIRAVLLDNGVASPWMQLHMTHANLIPAMAYADVLYDGEDFYVSPGSKVDFMDNWPLAMITAIDSPHTWGVPTRFLGNVRGNWPDPNVERAQMRTAIAETLLVDCFIDQMRYPLGGVGQALKTWGVDANDCTFVGYWRGRFDTADDDVKVSAYRRPGRLLLVVSNFSHEAKTATIAFDPAGMWDALGEEPVVADAESPAHKDLQCKVSGKDGKLQVQVGPVTGRDFRLIRIERAPR